MIVFADARGEVADFLAALLWVYLICIIGYIVMQLVFSLGVRIPYSRWSRAVMDFLSEVSEPYLRIFRPLPLRIGAFDLTPIVAIILLQVVGGVIIDLVRG